MRTVAGFALLALLAPAWAKAQPQDRLIAYSFMTSTAWCTLYEVAPSGAILSTVASLPAAHVPFSLVMAADNRSYLALMNRQTALTGCLLEVAPSGTVKTLISGSPLHRPVAVVRDCDGAWILAHEGYRIYGLSFFRVRGTTLTSLSTVPTLFASGMAVDEDTGLVVVRGMNQTTPSKDGYFRVDPRTGTVTDFAITTPTQTKVAYIGAKEPTFEGPSGALIDALLDWPQDGTRLFRAHPGKGILPITKTLIPWRPIDLAPAGQRTAGVGYYLLAGTPSSPPTWGLVRVKPDGEMLDASAFQGFIPYQSSKLLRIGSRHLTWFMDSPPNGRSLHLSFPGEGRRAYMVGLSWTGARPGLRLPDGREIPLIADYLTMLCLLGGVKGILDNTFGSLDASGNARVTVNTNRFGTALNGLRIWAVALVLDAKASSGIAYIVGPKLLTIR